MTLATALPVDIAVFWAAIALGLLVMGMIIYMYKTGKLEGPEHIDKMKGG